MIDRGPISNAELAELVSSRLRDIPDFPTPGVAFKDFTPLLADGDAFATLARATADRYRGEVEVVTGIEARGFILGGAIAHSLGVGFVPIRKAGKLPGRVLGRDYALEYGTARIEVHDDAFTAGQHVLVVDDVLATGGTAEAACALVEQCRAHVTAVEFVIEIAALAGRSRLPDRRVHSVLTV